MPRLLFCPYLRVCVFLAYVLYLLPSEPRAATSRGDAISGYCTWVIMPLLAGRSFLYVLSVLLHV